jgi:transposase
MVHRHFGIDIAKQTFQVCFVYKNKATQQSFTNNELGFSLFMTWAKDLCPKGRLRFCLEHTGGYESGLVQYLQRLKLHVSVVDGGKIFHFRRSLGKLGKSDPTDAFCLALYSRQRMPEAYCPRPDPYVTYVQLARTRDAMVEQLTALRNRANAPMVLSVVREQLDMVIAVTVHAIENLEQKMTELEAALPELGEQVALLTTISGVALTSARQILAEMGPVNDYPTPEKLALAAGLVPIARRSGTSLNQRGLVSYGNARLRCAIYRCALVAKKYDPGIQAFAARLNRQGNKSKKTVIVACARKLAHVVWALLTYKTTYNPQTLMKDAKLT